MNALDLFDDEFMLTLFGRFPLMLVYFGAIVGALVLWRRQRRAAALALSGSVILLFAECFEFFWELLLLGFVEIDEVIDFVDFAIVFARPLVQAVGMALVVAAVFVGRSTPAAGRFEDDIV